MINADQFLLNPGFNSNYLCEANTAEFVVNSGFIQSVVILTNFF